MKGCIHDTLQLIRNNEEGSQFSQELPGKYPRYSLRLLKEAQVCSILFNAELEAQRIKIAAKAKVQSKRDEIAARKEGISYSEYQNRMLCKY